MACVELKNTLSEIYCMCVIAGAHCKRKDQWTWENKKLWWR